MTSSNLHPASEVLGSAIRFPSLLGRFVWKSRFSLGGNATSWQKHTRIPRREGRQLGRSYQTDQMISALARLSLPRLSEYLERDSHIRRLKEFNIAKHFFSITTAKSRQHFTYDIIQKVIQRPHNGHQEASLKSLFVDGGHRLRPINALSAATKASLWFRFPR
ncbi:hypothetical protein LX32DRAFT_79930 [Colletotrichum zoysiae]|uniref:Uncharacterized protein n=1 Tax=Colletotrichum zoysiae TaxID=1216348 RepID=A0AAD9HB44_9PEZI|nr:hypothetical protein LX32DRAFT_79930 [Colletotrichum zoysiae]